MRTVSVHWPASNICGTNQGRDHMWVGELLDDSMEPTYPLGSAVSFSYDELPKDGDCCLVDFKRGAGTVLFAKVEGGAAMYRLSPLNPAYEAIIVPAAIVHLVLRAV